MYQKLMNAQDMPLSTLQITGTRPYSSDLDVQQALMPLSEKESFFSVEMTDVKETVELVPWIKEATVRRQWPNGLIIHVTDQMPVAHWNEQHLLNIDGDVFLAPKDKIEQVLPQFYGPDNVPKDVLVGYRALLPLFLAEGLKLKEIHLSERESWSVILADGTKLILGRANKVIRNARVERFLKVYKHVIPPSKAINYVDLRYDTGFAVNWKDLPGDRAQNEQS
ncbi:cell division protein FtsQ/DivIB [Psychrobium sp. 1_MG-2023]|uniref:cell division protein FtsQ/DivIB n=1 Tax=Psychrobium sp. 1_MG-2023 TaxID=3062624 RepID=UPI002732E2C0|nr:cell division protein FtsQ/DivIB [Psychrobium sp. 1_MG-2023]MDP2561465.1 cell division protein FtsQ/DivIB [Psychrobium sp. 1_MG-2023]